MAAFAPRAPVALAAEAGPAAVSTAASVVAAPLFDFAIAGGWYYELYPCVRTLAIGDHLFLRAEPDNPYDANAVVVERADGAKLGYVPRSANAPVAFILAEGGRVEAEIVGWLGADEADDLACTSHMSGDPRIRLSIADGAGWSTTLERKDEAAA